MKPTAYGLAIDGLSVVEDLQESDDADAIPVHVSVDTASPPPAEQPVGPDGGVRTLRDGRHLHLDRRAGRAVFHGPPLSSDLLAHPYLGPVATAFNRWYGREAFHAGVFVSAGRAWVVSGPRTAGKSTLLAALAARRTEVLSDDILVTDGVRALPGPRCIDLREEPPFEGLSWRRVRRDDRLRVSLPRAATAVPLGGWFFLTWSEDVRVRPVPPAVLLSRLAAGRAWRRLASDPTTLLALATLPAWSLERPRRFDALPETLALLTQVTSTTLEPAPVRAAVR